MGSGNSKHVSKKTHYKDPNYKDPNYIDFDKIPNTTIIEIIEKYEYIKRTKNMNDINKIADVIRTTDWDRIGNWIRVYQTNNNSSLIVTQDVKPSAPPATDIPIVCATIMCD